MHASEYWGKPTLPIEEHSLKVLNNQNNKTDVQDLLGALKSCSRTRNLRRGIQVHAEAMECGYDCHIHVESALINMYAKCRSMAKAREVFDGMQHSTVVSWNSLIMGYADNGQGLTALDMFIRMRSEGLAPDSVTLVAVLKACTSLAVKEGASRVGICRDKGKGIHNLAVETGYNSDVYLQNTLIDMYGKCISMVDASEVFAGMKRHDVVSWNVLILGYVANGIAHTALDMFTRMGTEGLAPDAVTLMGALKACTSLAMKKGIGLWTECRDMGKEIYNIAVQNGCNSVIVFQNTLVDMFANCGSMVDAHEVFDSIKHPDVVSWNVLISGYVDNGDDPTAVSLFTRMRVEGPEPDTVTLVAIVKACTSLTEKSGRSECMDKGKEIHNFIVENGCNSDIYVQSTLVDMYSKSSSMVDAQVVFNSMKHPDVVSWNVLILGYADNGQGRAALDIFIRMKTEGPLPDRVTFGAALKACALVGAVEFGRRIHAEIDAMNDFNVVLVTCLVDFYAKSGNLVEAERVFYLHPATRDTITWNALLLGFCICGDNDAVFQHFKRMQDAGFKPDDITFLCILTCCSHVGLVVKGKECFDAMLTKYAVIPNVKHYTCMIDLFGRSNKLDDAMTLLESMPCSPSSVTWMTILSACRKWNNVELGRLAFESVIDLNEKELAAYVLMEQIYGSKGMLQEQGMVMEVRKKLKVFAKKPGETCWTNQAGEVHTFLAHDSPHPQLHEIHEKLESITDIIRQHGFTTEDEAICGHSERLALACALLNTKSGTTITIVKNLRVCDECHATCALISKVECRTITYRDASRIHVFESGNCSCGDIW